MSDYDNVVIADAKKIAMCGAIIVGVASMFGAVVGVWVAVKAGLVVWVGVAP